MSVKKSPNSFLIVGAGLFGSVCAHELAKAGCKVLVVERRDHIGGNCFTRYLPEVGCHHHVYGAHIFHTQSKPAWDYINQFSSFNHYKHHAKVNYQGRIFSFPINLLTLNQIYGVTTPQEAKACLAKRCLRNENPQNLEEWCLSQVGTEIYEIFFKGYTLKQWQKDPSQLPVEIIRRIPIRMSFDDQYFIDAYQGIPTDGYTIIFERMLKNIPIELNVDFNKDRDHFLTKFDHIIYTGPVDEFFNQCEGKLEYRSLRFEDQMIDIDDAQGTSVINYTDDQIAYTRTIEHKHFERNRNKPKTLVTTEYPQDWQPGLPEFYPLNTLDNHVTYQKYKKRLTDENLPVTFGGRLGEYRYYDMDQAIESALATIEQLLHKNP